MTSLEILGCRVDAVDREEAVARIAALARDGRGALVVTLGVEMVMAAQHDAAFRTLVNGAALSVCDTIGILLASRVRGGALTESTPSRRAPSTTPICACSCLAVAKEPPLEPPLRSMRGIRASGSRGRAAAISAPTRARWSLN